MNPHLRGAPAWPLRPARPDVGLWTDAASSPPPARWTWPLRLSFTLGLTAVLGAFWPPGPAQAQSLSPVPSLASADPAQAAALPDWSALAPPALQAPALPAALDEAIRRWQAANRAVGEFPLGHADLLRWEQTHSPQPASNSAATPSPPAAPALRWPQVWQAVQALHAQRILGPGRNTAERQQAQARWLALERQAHQAWVQAITAQALLRLQHERLHAARTAHALGERMAALGHWSRARFIPVQQALAQEQAALLAAQWQARQSLEALAGAMGLWQADQVQALAQRLPTTLPAPSAVTPPAHAEASALAPRPALQWQREAAERALQAVSPAQWARWSEELERVLATTAERAQQTPQALPQWPMSALRGDHALDKALAEQRALQGQSGALRSLVRQAWDQLQATQALDSLQHAQLLPLAQAAETETLLRYNGMLQSTWDVIDAARARLGAQAEALRARQAHWQAHIDWHTLMAGGDIEPPAGPSTGKNETGGPAKGH